MKDETKKTIVALALGALDVGSAVANSLSVLIGIPAGTALENHAVITTVGSELVNRIACHAKVEDESNLVSEDSNVSEQGTNKDNSDEMTK